MQCGKLLERHGSRFVQPPEIGRKVCNGRFHDDPGARFIELLQPSQSAGVRIGRWIVEKRFEIRIRLDVVFPSECFGAVEETFLRRVTADVGQRGELRKRSLERNRGVQRAVGRNRDVSLSARPARGALVLALPSFRSGSSQPATRRSRL